MRRGYEGLQGVMGEIVGNLLENYWFLDSFGADLVLENEREWGTGVRGDLQFVQQFWEVMWYN